MRAGLSQAEIARRSGTSQAAVARYETGQVSPSASTLERLLQACGFTLGLRLRPHVPEPFLIDVVTGYRVEIRERAADYGVWHLWVVGSAAHGVLDDGSQTIELLADTDVDNSIGPLDALAEDLTAILGRRVEVSASGPRPPGDAGPAHTRGIPL